MVEIAVMGVKRMGRANEKCCVWTQACGAGLVVGRGRVKVTHGDEERMQGGEER